MTEEYVTQRDFEKFRDDVMPRINQLERDVLLIPETLKVIEFKIDANTTATNSHQKTIDQTTGKIIKWCIGGVVTFGTAVLGMAVSVIASDWLDLAETAAKAVN